MVLSEGVREHAGKSYFWLRASSGFAHGLPQTKCAGVSCGYKALAQTAVRQGRRAEPRLPFHTVPLVSDLASGLRRLPVRWPGYL